MFQVKHGYRWLILGLVLALLLVSGIDATYAKLVGGVQARKPNDQAVELKVTVDADGLIKVVIGTNQITFQVKANQELDTGLLRISGDLVQVIENGQLVCKIPVNDIPTAYKRFCYDERKPVVRVSQSPSPNSYGWNNGNVAITVTAEDEEGGSGIKSIFYKIGTRSPVEVGAAQLSISQGGRVATYSLTISDEGTQNLGFWAVDQAGNESEHQTLTVRIDQTRPTISGSRSPGPNSYGWNNADVTVSFNCSDSLSGIASCTGQQRVSREGSGQSVTGEAVDKAGNSATATVSNINIDKTQPSISLSPSGGTYKDSVTFSWSASDGLSGLASCSVYVNGSRVSSNSSGSYTLSPGTHSVEVRAEDKAGNSRSVSVGYTVERKKPAYFDITDLSAPSRANVGDSVSISATVRNTGEERGTQDIKLYIDGSWKDSKSLSLSPGESGTVRFYYTFSYSGYYTIKVASDNDYATRSIDIVRPSGPPRITNVTWASISLPFIGVQVGYFISFSDPDGDIIKLRHDWTGPSSGSETIDVSSVTWGRTSGTFIAGWAGCEPADVVWIDYLTLIDSQGNVSNTWELETYGYAYCALFGVLEW